MRLTLHGNFEADAPDLQAIFQAKGAGRAARAFRLNVICPACTEEVSVV